MYDEKDRYRNINFLGNILPVVQTYKASYFNAVQTEVDMDIHLCKKEKTNTKLLEAILVNDFGSNDFL